MSGEVKIRGYTPDDWVDVCRAHDEARLLELEHGGIDERAFRPMREVASDDEFFESRTLVALIDGRTIGFVSWRDDYITWLYVDPAYHRRGIGRRLLLECLRHIGPDAWTNTIPENRPAFSLYQSVGMELVWVRTSQCEGFPCNTARLALPTSRMRAPEAKPYNRRRDSR